MLINTHILIGRYCYNRCIEEFGLDIDKKRYLYGCIEPDLHRGKYKVSHTYTDSIERMNEYRNLVKDKEVQLEDTSFLLGKMSHYIADYFCKYHLEENFDKDMKEHFAYERVLHKRLKKLLKHNCDECFEDVFDDLKKNVNYLDELEKMRLEYRALEDSHMKDLYFTIKATCYLLYCAQDYIKDLSKSERKLG